MYVDLEDRLLGAWWGAFLGDAIAMPTHGYSSMKMLRDDYGEISEMRPANAQHPESVLYSIDVPPLPREFDFLGENRRKLWSIYGTHPHHAYVAGQSTLPMYLALHLTAAITDPNEEFHFETWMRRYRAVMIAEGGHPDTFIPTVHRRYFENLATGRDVKKDACAEAHIGDIVIFLPLILEGLASLDASHRRIFKGLAYFCSGESAPSAAFFLSEVFALCAKGTKLEDVLYAIMNPDRHSSLAFPYRRWIKNRDEDEAINMMGRFARIEEALPLSIYFCLKYAGDIKKALLANANTGGETTGRGAVIGMLMGAQCGFRNLPQDWIANLKYAGEIRALGDLFAKSVFKK